MKVRNRADEIMANRCSRIPSDVEVMYFSQNHQYECEDWAAELDKEEGVLEGCDVIVDLSAYFDLLGSHGGVL